ncbi:nitroreductase family protein [Amycolatopsis aidingensis]|uniref:nitroreductase family protein n=1 Tax=Amycolatopsis aidingensis TaxID=2842453 RepID=UPI001C0DCEE9|nr:nitroreductase family protein [Amycolatopsis aidingensis]
MDKIAETSVPVHDLIARRWSPRAFDPTAEVDDRRLRALLEAARWAPSSGNTQPARFLLGRRPGETFTRILGTLAEGNQGWAHRASVLLVGCAVTRNEKGEIPLSEYAVGLAGQNLVLQAVAEGLIGHQMAGFDAEAVRREFDLPEDVRPVVAIAVGTQAEPELLGEDRKIERERAPRQRIPLAEFAYTGEWGSPAF